jgi:hypothetical protein
MYEILHLKAPDFLVCLYLLFKTTNKRKVSCHLLTLKLCSYTFTISIMNNTK